MFWDLAWRFSCNKYGTGGTEQSRGVEEAEENGKVTLKRLCSW